MTGRKRRESSAGFTLIETMIAVVVLAIGVLSLAAMLANGLAYMNMSQDDFIAQQKAAEAIESIYTARNDKETSWQGIYNVGTGTGIFSVGPQQLCDPGADGIVGTADDNCALPDSIVLPGPDGKLGTADDQFYPLATFTRQIIVTDIATRPNLRQIQIIIRYKAGQFTRQYTLNSYISRYS